MAVKTRKASLTRQIRKQERAIAVLEKKHEAKKEIAKLESEFHAKKKKVETLKKKKA